MLTPAEISRRTAAVAGATVFHAGTRRQSPNGRFRTAGGRVLGVTAVAPTLAEARTNAYAAAAPITWDGRQFRTDIAELAARANEESVR